MDVLSEKYLKLNPFVQNSVGENIIWGSAENDFCDVESIHKNAFNALLKDIESVNGDGKTRALFLVGPAGSGKSHLFARLRRRLPNGQFTFVSNPPTTMTHIKRFILRKVVYGMTKPVMGPDGPLPYSQLQGMVYSLLKLFLRERNWSIDQIHKRWEKLSPSSRSQKIRKLEEALARTTELSTMSDVSRVLVRILDKEKCHLAASWLSGNQNLTEDDFKCLEIPGPLGDVEISELMKQLGRLSFRAGPIVLILDQLDSLVKPDQIREIESLMIDLNDGSRNWYLIVSLVQEKFDLWISTLSIPFKQRFGTVTHDSVSLTTAELSGLSEAQRRELILARLSTPGLLSQRQSDGVDDPFYPFSEKTIRDLTLSEISNPRMLIQMALKSYVDAVTGSTQMCRMALSDFIEQRFADLRAEFKAEALGVDTASVADRIRELFRLLWSAWTRSAFTETEGPLHVNLASFEGVDREFNCDGRRVRLICYDVQQTNKFPSVLKRIVKAPTTTILVRDGRVRISGKATKEKLDLFQKDKKFFHLSLDEVNTLHALGSLLATMREGEFENQDTEPKPTESAIYECLAQQRDLVETELAQSFLEMVGLAGSKPVNHPSDTENEIEVLAADDPLVLGVEKLMEQERWMSFERLCVRINARGITADPPQIYQCLKNKPVCESVLVYPRDVNLLKGIGIVIWNTEE